MKNCHSLLNTQPECWSWSTRKSYAETQNLFHLRYSWKIEHNVESIFDAQISGAFTCIQLSSLSSKRSLYILWSLLKWGGSVIVTIFRPFETTFFIRGFTESPYNVEIFKMYFQSITCHAQYTIRPFTSWYRIDTWQ